MIVTYGTIKAKQAVKDSSPDPRLPVRDGRPDHQGDAGRGDGQGRPAQGDLRPRAQALRRGRRVPRRSTTATPTSRRVVDTAIGIEGLKRQWGVHAAGVIMSSEPLIDVIPLLKRPADGAMITQFDYPTCEALGLIKMDFLGLRNLTVLDDARAATSRPTAARPWCSRSSTLDRRGDLPAARSAATPSASSSSTAARCGRCCGSMRPDSFEDISAVGALYRPGPMGADSHNKYARRKTGREPVEPIHPELAEPLAEILGETYGLIVYQEQVMAIAQKLAGYTLGQADLLRRAMGKKKKEELDSEYAAFSAGMTEPTATPIGAIKALWDILLPFSDYAFNKAHSAAYGLVSYWTAYLKANYPAEYMAALLTSVKDDKDKMAIYLNECRRMKIQVLPPDVNESAANFTPVGNDIRFGLTAIRNVGAQRRRRRSSRRASEKGRYADFNDFMEKVPGAGLQQAGHRVADQGRRLRRDEAQAAGAGGRSTRRPSTSTSTSSATRRSARTRCSAASTTTPAAAFGISVTDPRHRRVGQDDAARPRARHARPLRLRPPAARPRARALATAPTAPSAS